VVSMSDSTDQWSALWLSAREVVSSMLIAHCISSCPVTSEQLITVISVTEQSTEDCLLTMGVPTPTQPSIPPGSVNEDQHRLTDRQTSQPGCIFPHPPQTGPQSVSHSEATRLTDLRHLGSWTTSHAAKLHDTKFSVRQYLVS